MPQDDEDGPVGRDDIPFAFEEGLGEGVRAVFSPEGHLQRLMLMRGGRVQGHDLRVEPTTGAAYYARIRSYPDSADPSDGPENSLGQFLRGAIDEMAKTLPGAPLRCAFCEKTQAEVARLIAGPMCYICDECVRLCHAIIQDEPPSGITT
jgi:hypothetical protein